MDKNPRKKKKEKVNQEAHLALFKMIRRTHRERRRRKIGA
jgi:hypothetical protein